MAPPGPLKSSVTSGGARSLPSPYWWETVGVAAHDAHVESLIMLSTKKASTLWGRPATTDRVSRTISLLARGMNRS